MDGESPTIFDAEGRSTIQIDEIVVIENEHATDGEGLSNVVSNIGLASPNQNLGTLPEGQDITPDAQSVHTSVAQTSKVGQVSVDVHDSSEPDEPPHKKRNTSDDDDVSLCPICLDNWTNVGEHRVCALKCGHLFGLKCITRWFSSQMNKICPSCKKRASRSDLRYIYAQKIVAVDATELEIIRKQLHNLAKEKNNLQLSIDQAAHRENILIRQREYLQKRVRFLESSLEGKQQFIPVKLEKVAAWIPNYSEAYSPATILSRLERQNPELETHTWRVYDMKTYARGQRLTLGVPQQAFLVLKATEYRPYYGLGRVQFWPLTEPGENGEKNPSRRWPTHRRPQKRSNRAPLRAPYLS